MSSLYIKLSKVFLTALVLIAVAACETADLPTSPVLKVMSAQATSSTSVDIVFSDSVGAGGNDPSHYVIGNLEVTAAVVNGKSVTLSTAEQSATRYTVTVTNLLSVNSKPLATDAYTASFQGKEGTAPEPEEFTALSATSASPTSVTIRFSSDVGAGGSDPSSYHVQGLDVTAAAVAGSNVTLTTSEQSDKVYILTFEGFSGKNGVALEEASLEFQGTAADTTPGPDTTPPTVIWLEPKTDKQVTIGETLFLSVGAADNNAVASISITINDDLLIKDSKTVLQTEWNTSELEEGAYVLKAVATDEAGNVAEKSLTLTLADPEPEPDTTPPTLTWLAPVNGASFEVGTVVKLEVDADDDEELESVSFYINGSLLEEVDDEAYEASWSTAGLGGGRYTLKAVATDEAGNQMEKSISVTLSVPVVNKPYSDGSVNLNYGSDAHHTYFKSQVAKGYRPISVSGYGSKSALFAAAWQKSSTAFASYREMTAAQYQQRFDTLTRQGYRPTYVDGYTVNGQTRFAAIWEKSSGPAWIARHNMTSAQYQSLFNTYKARGYRPVHVSGYDINGQAYYAAIWEKRSGTAWAARHGLSSAQYQSFATEYAAKGYRITHVSGYTIGTQVRFAAVMEKTSGPAWIARHDMATESFTELHESYKREGYRIVQVDGYRQGDAARFAAIWQK